ncbi:MAG: hypothetical protein Q9170_001051 [Blastenia crenularia]
MWSDDRPSFIQRYDEKEVLRSKYLKIKESVNYQPGRTVIEPEDSYEHEDLRPSFPNVHWEPLTQVPYHDKGLQGDPQFRNLLQSATDVFDYNPKIGTEVHGVNLAKLTDAQKNDLARLISVRGVVFFRNQTDLDIDTQRELGAYFGKLHKHATTSVPRRSGLEDVHVVYTDGSSKDQRAVFAPTFLWHSDVTYEVQPPAYTSLKLLSGPPRGGGGDTLWSSQYGAYDLLSAPMQKYLEGLSALHSAQMQADGSIAAGRPVRRDPIVTKHPLIRTHPVTGWKSLFFNPGFVTGIVGIPKAESDAILRYLNEIVATTQEIHVRYQWQKNDVAFWDNRICNHSASYGFAPHRRHAVRVANQAERPVFDPAGKSQEEELNALAGFAQPDKDGAQVNPLGSLPTPDEVAIQLDDASIWEHFRHNAASPKSERLTAVKEASALLAATNAKLYEDCEFEDPTPISTHRIRDLKHELPLLRSDHEMDMLNFVHRIDPNLEDEFFPFEKVDDEQDEGFGWPSHYHELPELWFQRVRKEKLEVKQGVFAYMKGVLETRTEKGEEPTFDYELPNYRRNRLRDPITPPLLPRSPSPLPYEPSSETSHLDLLSEHSSPTRQQLKQIDQIILEKDALTPLKRRTEPGDDCHQAEMSDISSIGNLYSPLKSISNTPSPPFRKRIRREDLKVEGPLTPPASDRPPPWDIKVPFSEALKEVIPILPPLIPEPENLSPNDIDMLFAEQIAPIAAKAEQAIEQEQLQEADTTCRVPVPVMDFTKPVPPWMVPPPTKLDEWKTKFLCDIRDSQFNLHPWKSDGQTEKTELSWVPFPMSLGRFELQETIADDGSLAGFIEQPESHDPATLTWKRPGLRFLDDIHDSDEEELAFGDFASPKDVQSLVKKRNFELHGEGENDFASADAEEYAHTTMAASKGTHTIEGPLRPREDKSESQNDQVAILPGFSALDALDQFLGVRKGELSKSYQPKKKRPPPVALKDSATASNGLNLAAPNVAEKAILDIPKPQLRVPDVRAYFIASTSFLSNRKLAHEIRDLYPSAEIIERDFTTYNLRPAYAESRSNTRQANFNTSLDEADLILSPSTGLILTSVQKIKQQSLPGQSTRSPVRERIHQIASRYERFIVLVSRNSPMTNSTISWSRNLDESDCEALTFLTTFVNHLPALNESDVILVDGDNSVLATWIVSLMVKYSSQVSTTLLEEETQWEVFLRRAGMNAFAAQVVLANTKAVGGNGEVIWGLRKFISMSLEERFQRFEGLLGGRGVLERVGKLLDAPVPYLDAPLESK